MSYVKAVKECIAAGLPDEDYIIYLPVEYELAITSSNVTPAMIDVSMAFFCYLLNDPILVAQTTIDTKYLD